jgi:cobalt/nickel transport system permease protein
MKHNYLDRYANLESPLHAMDARTKLAGFTALILAALSIPANRGEVFFAYFVFAAILMGVSQIPLSYIAGRILILLPFVALAALAAPLRAAGHSEWFLALLLRSVLSLILLVLLTNTTPFAELVRALRSFGCPRTLTANLSFLYRYAFVLTDEVLRMRQARACRQTAPMPLRRELKTLGAMLGVLLIRSFERAESMYMAMLSRGYSGEIPTLAPRRFGPRDLAFLALIAAFIGGGVAASRAFQNAAP